MTDTVRDVAATVRGTEAELVVDGQRRQLTGHDVDAVRESVFMEVTALAAAQGGPVRFTIVEGGTRWHLVVQPDGGRATEYSEPAGRPNGRRPIPNAAVPEPERPSDQPVRSDQPVQPDRPESSWPEPSEQEQSRPAAPGSEPVQSEPALPAPTAAPTSAASPFGQPDVRSGGVQYGSVRPGSGPGPQQPVGAGSGGESEPGGRRGWPPVPPVPPEPDRSTSSPSPEPQPRHAVSFLPPEQPVELPAAAPPQQGFFGRLFGRKTNEPDPALVAAQRAEAADQALVSKHWPGPKTIAVVNGKGGSGKTPTTALLAAVFARYGGGGVIAWDNNDTRGTLGWRTAAGGHDRTVLDLIPATEELMDRDAQVGRLAYFVHHQPEDKYDVLRSNPELLAREQRLSTEQFRALHAVCNRFYRLVFMDSGNDESTYAWLNMIEAADQIVVPTSTRPDHAEAALLLLQALANRNAQGKALADRAVVIVSQADQDEAAADTIAAGFRQLLPAESVVTIPYDRAIRDSQLRYDRLTPTTQRAFLRAAAAVAGQL